MKRASLMIDRKNCMGCHACEVACKQEHGLGVGPQLIRIMEKSFEFVPTFCHHCAKPPCRDVCPENAIYKTGEDVVLIDNDKCIGCQECVGACPFGAMQFDDGRGIAVKCDLCPDLRAEGKKTACMSVCATRCIRYGGNPPSVAEAFESAS